MHRLVAKVYIPNPNPELFNIVCHKDNNPKNNHYKNLYWGTQKMNMEQAHRDGRMSNIPRGPNHHFYGLKGELSLTSKFSNNQRIAMYMLYINGVTITNIADTFHISKSQLRRILKTMALGLPT